MRKTTIVLIIGVFVAANLYCKVNDLSIPKITNTEQIETQRIEKLDLMQTREYAQKSLKSVGRLNVLEGKYRYSNEIESKFFNWTVRQITLDMEYKYCIGIDLQNVVVRSVFDKIIVIQIPKNKLELQYIELDIEKSKVIDGDKMLFVSQFKPSEVENLLEESQYNVAGKINSDDKLFDQALVNLKSELEKLTQNLGYNETIFEVI